MYHWINDSVKVTGPITLVLKNTMKEAEELDLSGSGEYFQVADTLDVIGKALYASGKWTKEDWDNLCRRYPCE